MIILADGLKMEDPRGLDMAVLFTSLNMAKKTLFIISITIRMMVSRSKWVKKVLP